MRPGGRRHEDRPRGHRGPSPSSSRGRRLKRADTSLSVHGITTVLSGTPRLGPPAGEDQGENQGRARSRAGIGGAHHHDPTYSIITTRRGGRLEGVARLQQHPRATILASARRCDKKRGGLWTLEDNGAEETGDEERRRRRNDGERTATVAPHAHAQIIAGSERPHSA